MVAVSEMSRYMDNAVELYQKAGPRFYRQAMRLVTVVVCGVVGLWFVRSAIIQSAILRGRTDSPQKLLKTNGDIPDAGLRCALLLERAARLQRDAGQVGPSSWGDLVRVCLGKVRKMCFHLVLAGHTFNKAGYKQWALA